MNIDFKDIHIGSLIQTRVMEMGIDMNRICSNMKLKEEEINNMYQQDTLETKVLLKWCKLLEYDFFRFFSQHLILFTSPMGANYNRPTDSVLPQFRKNLYTKEVIFYILEIIESNEKTHLEVINDYKIPKSTLRRWMVKYKIR
ncbi:transposase [Chryseobacterium sp. ISL-6]|uniref:transposase n=1 Tax=Chryseobacterium sp. ISL-6 TaxID=2819143 RepID=UPI001BE82D25|nr:transposase [Chryseobacterium sp. ISL-6]MBT2623510.1 transposase [Chryseobacterium sp. ISL-6]